MMCLDVQEHEVAKVAEYVNELFDKTKTNEKGLEQSLRTLDEKVRTRLSSPLDYPRLEKYLILSWLGVSRCAAGV